VNQPEPVIHAQKAPRFGFTGQKQQLGMRGRDEEQEGGQTLSQANSLILLVSESFSENSEVFSHFSLAGVVY
jgi:hypothetical protein